MGQVRGPRITLSNSPADYQNKYPVELHFSPMGLLSLISHSAEEKTTNYFQIRSFKCRERERLRKGKKTLALRFALALDLYNIERRKKKKRKKQKMPTSFSLSRSSGSSRLQVGAVSSQRQRSLSARKPPEPLRRAVADCLSSASSSSSLPASSLHGNPSIAASEAARTLRVSNSCDSHPFLYMWGFYLVRSRSALNFSSGSGVLVIFTRAGVENGYFSFLNCWILNLVLRPFHFI